MSDDSLDDEPPRAAGGKGPEAFRTISEVADDLDLPQHVLRFWETRFSQIRPMKRGGGRRYYRPDDVDLLRGIRRLLYGEGYTIKGVQRILKDQGLRAVIAIGHGAAAPAVEGGQARHRADEAMFDQERPEGELADAGTAEPDDDGERELSEAIRLPEEALPAGIRPEPARITRRAGLMDGLLARRHGGLSADDIRSLQATMGDLLEMKRLLDSVR